MPTFFLILKWGYQPERLQAGVLILIYTVSASLPLIVCLLKLWNEKGSDNILLEKIITSPYERLPNLIWLVLLLGFLVKLPIYRVHGWLPKAHVEAPLSGSMLLAGILLKFGGYGLVRFVWVFRIKFSEFSLFLIILSLWGGVLTSCLCVCQSDLKSFIAYSSIGHMAIRLGGVIRIYSLGKMSCVCLLFAHGLCSPILFSLSARLYDFIGSRNVLLRKGLLLVFPVFSTFWFIFCVINIGLPPSLNFIREVYCVGRILWLDYVVGIVGGAMCFMAGCYCLIIYSLVNHGNMRKIVKPYYRMSSRYLVSCLFIVFILLVGFIIIDYFIL